MKRIILLLTAIAITSFMLTGCSSHTMKSEEDANMASMMEKSSDMKTMEATGADKMMMEEPMEGKDMKKTGGAM